MKRFTQFVCGALRLASVALAAFVVAGPALAQVGTPNDIPEPGTLSLLAVGVVGAVLLARRNRRK